MFRQGEMLLFKARIEGLVTKRDGMNVQNRIDLLSEETPTFGLEDFGDLAIDFAQLVTELREAIEA